MKDGGILLAIGLLILWAIGTALGWPGWIHGALTGGLVLLIYRIVKRST